MAMGSDFAVRKKRGPKVQVFDLGCLDKNSRTSPQPQPLRSHRRTPTTTTMLQIFALVTLTVVVTAGKPGTPLGGIPTTQIAPGVDLPMQGIGTWLYNSSRAEQAVLTALTLKPTPYVHIDTALVYGNQDGVGRAIQRSGRARKSFFLTTKIPGGLNATYTQTSLEKDLALLQVDYVDLMLVHYPCTMDAHEAGGKASRQAMWKVMEKFVNDGKARAIGVSHYCERHLKDLFEINTVPVAVNQVQYHVGMGSSSTSGANATDNKAFCDANGVTYQSFSPLCGPCQDAKGNPDKSLITGPLVTSIGKKYGKSGAQVSLKWQIQLGIPVIPKTDNPVHLQENIDLFDWTLSEADMTRLTAATGPAVAGVGTGAAAVSGDCTIA
jgi:diketogulonate reductase-like aldo/keto reductase